MLHQCYINATSMLHQKVDKYLHKKCQKNAKKCQKYICVNITKNAVNKLIMKTFITRKYKILTNTYTYTYKKNAKNIIKIV